MPRNRNQPAVIAPLSVEQETTLGGFGNLLTGVRGESVLETVERLFGGAEAAAAGWYDHRDALMADDPIAGRRPAGFWLFEHQREPPPSAEQAAILRELGELREREEQQLAEWRALTPESPDMSITQPGARAPVTEVPLSTNEIASADPQIRAVEEPNGTHKVDGDRDAGPVEATEEAEAGEAPEVDQETAVTPPRILPMRRYGPDDRKPAGLEGWD